VGNERFNIFSGCPSGQTATIVLRGGADQVFYCYSDLSSLQINHNHTNSVFNAIYSSLRKLKEVSMMPS
jgi:hypothetical protein